MSTLLVYLSCILALAAAYHPGFYLSHLSLKTDSLTSAKAGLPGFGIAPKVAGLATEVHVPHIADHLDTLVDSLAVPKAAAHVDRKAAHLDHKADITHAARKVDHFEGKSELLETEKVLTHTHKANHLKVPHHKVSHHTVLSTGIHKPLIHRADLLGKDTLAAVAHVSHNDNLLNRKAVAHLSAHKTAHLDDKGTFTAHISLLHTATKMGVLPAKVQVHHKSHKAAPLAVHPVLAHAPKAAGHVGHRKITQLATQKISALHRKPQVHAGHKADFLHRDAAPLAVAQAVRNEGALADKATAHHAARKSDHLDDKADTLATQRALAADRADHVNQKAEVAADHAERKSTDPLPIANLPRRVPQKSVHSPHHKKSRPVTGCSPKEWEGEAFGQIVVTNPQSTAVSFESDISISHIWQMEVYDTVSEVTPTKVVRTTTYRDWKAGYEFEYNLDTEKCKVTKQLEGPMKRICIGGENVNYVRSFFVGAALADMVETDDFGTKGKSVTTMLRDTQIPVSVIATGNVQGSTQYLSMQYANVQIGIRDSEVFVVPDICVKALGASKDDE